ncbi:MAG: acetylesterase [Solobacterium sp.]|nr:acetylesterase [Solobacterium sp.]
MAFLQMSLYSRCLQRTVPVSCVVPVDTVDYLSQPLKPEKPFRTLYLLNGFFGNMNDWFLAGDVARLAIKYNIAFIMPAGENKFFIDNPSGEMFGTFIGDELVEMTRRLFPLSRERKDTWIGGLSMGGYGSLRNGLKYNETFGAILALSPGIFISEMLEALCAGQDADRLFGAQALFMNRAFLESSFGPLEKVNGSDKDYRTLFETAAKTPSGCPEIYLACGTEDPLLPAVRGCRDYLSGHGARLMYAEKPGIHDYDFWNTALQDALDHFPPMQENSD